MLHPYLKLSLVGLCGGCVPIAALLVPTIITGSHILERWGELLLVYLFSSVSSGFLYWKNSPAGREEWSAEQRAAYQAQQAAK